MQVNNIPSEVRNYLNDFIGNKESLIDGAGKDIEIIENNCLSLERQLHSDNTDAGSRAAAQKQLLALRSRIRELLAYLRSARLEIETAKRFLTDWRIIKVYGLLKVAFDDPDEEIVRSRWINFVYVPLALVPFEDFKPFNEMLSKAKENSKSIASKARELAILLADTSTMGFACPREFTSTAALLGLTDNALSPPLYEQWQWGREYLLGGPIPPPKFLRTIREPIEVIQKLAGPPNSKYSAQEAEFRMDLWTAAPSIPRLLQELSKSAEQWQANAAGFVNEVVSHRQRNKKNDFLRAMLYELRKRDVPFVPEAIATTASAVINEDIQAKEVCAINTEIH